MLTRCRWIARLVLICLGTAVLAGCASTGATTRQPAKTPGPNEFPWKFEAVEAVGTADSHSAVSSDLQRVMIGQQAAKTAAIANLKKQVMALRVTEDHSLGSIMKQNLGVKVAVEQRLQSADVVSQQRTPTGGFEVRVRMPLQSIAEVLEKQFITPEGLPTMPERRDDSVPPVS